MAQGPCKTIQLFRSPKKMKRTLIAATRSVQKPKRMPPINKETKVMTRTSLEVWQDLRPPSPGLSRYSGLHRIVASLPQSLPRLKNCSSKSTLRIPGWRWSTFLVKICTFHAEEDKLENGQAFLPCRLGSLWPLFGVPSSAEKCIIKSAAFAKCFLHLASLMIHLDPVTALMESKSETL